jgi:hypothetical protein
VPGWRAAADRVRRLATTLAGLRDRVREAVAAETGKAVADAVKDLLTAALGGRPADPPASHRPYRRDWDDYGDDDRWSDDNGDDDDRDDAPPAPPRAGTRWPAVIAAAAGAIRWWAARNLPGWVAAAVGAAAAAVVFAGGDVARAGTAVLTAAADLLPLTA